MVQIYYACVRNIDDEFLDKKKELENKNKNQIIPIEFDLSIKDIVKQACQSN